ncbi:MAG: 50S ribosomal protein L23 [Candidatus Micrarchaeia archaeon]
MKFIISPVATEKAVSGIERENRMTFLVIREATKPAVKREVEEDYKEKVEKVTIMISPKNAKKAFVKFKRAGAAADLAAKLKVI